MPPLFYDLDARSRRAREPRRATRRTRATVLEYAQRLLSLRMRHAERTLTGALVTPQGVIEARRPGRRRVVKRDRQPST